MRVLAVVPSILLIWTSLLNRTDEGLVTCWLLFAVSVSSKVGISFIVTLSGEITGDRFGDEIEVVVVSVGSVGLRIEEVFTGLISICRIF